MPQTVRLVDRRVARVGLGCAAWSLAEVPEDLARHTFHAALEAGVSIVDTARAYTTVEELQHNERLLGEFMVGLTERPLVVTKGGHQRLSATEWGIDGRPEVLARECRDSLAVLGLDAIPIYLLHRPDPLTPIADSIGALAALRSEGLVEAIGVSNVDQAQFDAACAVAKIDVVENLLSPFDVTSAALAEQCDRSSVGFLAYSPLGGPGTLSAKRSQLQQTATIAERHDVSLQRLLIAWTLRLFPAAVAVVGASQPLTIADSARAAELLLDAGEWDAISTELGASRV